jgi:hypothetical protein
MRASIIRATTLLSVLLTAGCATAPAEGPAAVPAAEAPQRAPSSAAGRYTFQSDFRGQSFEGVIRLSGGAGGAYTGTLTTPFTGELPVRSVDVQGSRTRVTTTGRMGEAVLVLDMAGSRFTGTWSYGGSNGQLTGLMTPGS